MNKNFIRLNTNDNYFSFGNFCRVVKEVSENKYFVQTDLFEIMFDTEDVADSTVNNYCTGFRPINIKYKNYYRDLFDSYKTNKKVFTSIISNIVDLLNDDTFSYSTKTIRMINEDKKLYRVCERLYSISKNDSDVSNLLSSELLNCLNNGDLYTFIVSTLNYVILEKKQPIYIEENINNLIEKSIYDTNISMKDIQEFIQIQLNSSIWSLRAFKQLASKGNPFACFEMASMEYNGIITGKPRYDKAYEYYMTAAKYNHPVATWAIGYLYYNGNVGTKSKRDLMLAVKYFNKARKLKCSNAFNSFGIIYLNGTIPHIKKNKQKAIEMFEEAISLGNIYAYNNLGSIYEKDKDHEKAIECYTISAENGDSWANNQLGEFYRKGIFVKKDLKKAFEYYDKSSDSTQFTMCPWAYYNLAKYFYSTGCIEIGVKKDLNKAAELLQYIENKLPESIVELINVYQELYKETSNDFYLDKLNFYKTKNKKA
ncbi:MAG: sel1 repeat family protein [Clostridia bacterium]|nr:sel1 repeat family protein [Clostridia bacterium]